MSLRRVAPMCEMRDCANRADYFWHWRVLPAVSWIPVCAACIEELAESIGWFDLVVSPIAELAAETYRASDVPIAGIRLSRARS